MLAMTQSIVRASSQLCRALLRIPANGLQQSPRYFARGAPRDSDTTVPSRLTGKDTKIWELYNEVIYPPRDNEVKVVDSELVKPEESRPAEITYTKDDILYSQKKLWLLAFMVCYLAFP